MGTCYCHNDVVPIISAQWHCEDDSPAEAAIVVEDGGPASSPTDLPRPI